MAEMTLRLSAKSANIDLTPIVEQVAKAIVDNLEIEVVSDDVEAQPVNTPEVAEVEEPGEGRPIGLIVPRHLMRAAQSLAHLLGPKNVLVFQIGEALMGLRLRGILIWKTPMSDDEENRFNAWLDGNVKMRLVPGCEKNFRVVEL